MADVIGGERKMVSRCGVIQETAASLAALGSDDATRVAAYIHAASCGACADALAEGATVIAWVDAALAETTTTAARSDGLTSDHAPRA